MTRFRKATIPSLSLAISLVILGCKPVAPLGAPDGRLTLDEVQHASDAVETVATPNTASPDGQPLTHEDWCKRAIDLLATCAKETTCSTEMTMLLPSAARSQYVLLSKQSGFVPQQFGRYCEAACRLNSSAVDTATFEKDVCIVASASQGTAQSPAIRLTVDGLEMPTDGVPLSDVIARIGHPTRITDSPFTCDSAFEGEDIKLHVYPNATFETDGAVAVLRSMNITGAANQVTFPTITSTVIHIEADLQQLRGFNAAKWSDHTYRTSTVSGGSLETAYDFEFVGGKLARVDYWIGC